MGNPAAAGNVKSNIATLAVQSRNSASNGLSTKSSSDGTDVESGKSSDVSFGADGPLLVSSISPNGSTSAGGDEVGLRQMVTWLGGDVDVNYKNEAKYVYIQPSVSNPKGGFQWQEQKTLDSVTVKLGENGEEHTFKNGEDFSVNDGGISMINKNKILDTFFGDIGAYGEEQPELRQAINYITRLCYEAGVPVKLGLAVAYTESQMRQFEGDKKVKINDNGGSIDWGMFQLNDRWHPVTDEMKSNWHANARYGIQHLAKCYGEAKRSGLYPGDELWKATYSNYNSGSLSAYANPKHTAHQDTKKHVSNFWGYYNEESWRKQQ